MNPTIGRRIEFRGSPASLPRNVRTGRDRAQGRDELSPEIDSEDSRGEANAGRLVVEGGRCDSGSAPEPAYPSPGAPPRSPVREPRCPRVLDRCRWRSQNPKVAVAVTPK